MHQSVCSFPCVCVCCAVGTGQDGTAATLPGGAQPAPGGAMGLSQSHMNGAAPRELASGMLDLSSSPDSSPVKVAFTSSVTVCRLNFVHLAIGGCGSCLSDIYACIYARHHNKSIHPANATVNPAHVLLEQLDNMSSDNINHGLHGSCVQLGLHHVILPFTY